MKMDKGQKQFRKIALANLLARGGIVATNGDMTAVFLPAFCNNGNGHFSTSIAGQEKFKRKYGEMVALERLKIGICLPINRADFDEFCFAIDLEIRENDPPISVDEPTPRTPACDALTPRAAWSSPVDYRKV